MKRIYRSKEILSVGYLLLLLTTCAASQVAITEKGDVKLGTANVLPENKTTVNGSLTVSGSLRYLGGVPAGNAVFGGCGGSNTNGPCTAEAQCPSGQKITSGVAFFIVPDGKAPAYGVCRTGFKSCATGEKSCGIKTEKDPDNCLEPGWGRQIAVVEISCQ